MTPLFETVLVANRGEIAVRITRTLRRLGIGVVAVYSDADADARHVREADAAVRLGPAPARDSYLDIAGVVNAALRTGATAIHPGYGFLSENAAFARACAEAGIVFLGPPIAAIETMGNKITAKTAVAAAGVPVVPGIARLGLRDADLVAAAADIGFPVLVKPSAGGGGKGMRRVGEPADLPAALASARREAAASFGDDTLFLERWVDAPRHIEVQVMADAHGAVIHLGERECSLQRRHQKVVEEAPSPLLDASTRERIGAAACATASSVNYRGAGTVEFIVSARSPDEFFFMEMNTRLQVEHPVTEAVTGLDLVEWQLRIAAGEPLPLLQNEVSLTGHALEARVYAEDPGREFLPTGGRVVALAEPSGAGVRVDSSLAAGSEISSDYDPMLAKVIAHGATRADALAALDHALAETSVLGVRTNLDFLRTLLANERVRSGDLDTSLLDGIAAQYVSPAPPDLALVAAALHRVHGVGEPGRSPWQRTDGWRLGGYSSTRVYLRGSDGEVEVRLTGPASDCTVEVANREYRVHAEGNGSLIVDNVHRTVAVAADGEDLWVHADGGDHRLSIVPRERSGTGTAGVDTTIISPMPGTVIDVPAASEARVEAGDPIVVVEAMKMEHVLRAPVSGIVTISVIRGDRVTIDRILATVNPEPALPNTAPPNTALPNTLEDPR